MRMFRSLVTLLVFTVACASILVAQGKRKVIVDQDAAGPGGTDMQAILTLIHSPETDVLGITVPTGDAWRDERRAKRGGQLFVGRIGGGSLVGPILRRQITKLYVDVDLDHGAGYGNTLIWAEGRQPGLGEVLVEVQDDLDKTKFYKGIRGLAFTADAGSEESSRKPVSQ